MAGIWKFFYLTAGEILQKAIIELYKVDGW